MASQCMHSMGKITYINLPLFRICCNRYVLLSEQKEPACLPNVTSRHNGRDLGSNRSRDGLSTGVMLEGAAAGRSVLS